MAGVLLIGYGNPGRQDDGLGPRLAELLEKEALPGLTLDADYQLTVEDSVAINDHDTVIFADASVDCGSPFEFDELAQPGDTPRVPSFTSHHTDPEALLDLTNSIYGRAPRAFTLRIRGYQFDTFAEQLSPEAERNLAAAADFIRGFLRTTGILTH